MTRPLPPNEVAMPLSEADFLPAPELADWVKTTFCSENGQLFNPDHAHLTDIDLCFLWAGVCSQRQGRQILGEAKLIGPSQPSWSRQMVDWQMKQWFGGLPLALITIDAEYAATCGDAEFCALIEHELYHLAHATDDFGMPRFTKQGDVVLAMRPHDVEEFVGVVRRYGSKAAGVEALVAAAAMKPEMPALNIARACGTCMLKAA